MKLIGGIEMKKRILSWLVTSAMVLSMVMVFLTHAGAQLISTALLAGGNRSGYAVGSDGSLWAWGNAQSYQLGNGSNQNSSIPVKIAGLNGVRSAAAGIASAYALMSDGTVRAWGVNDYGQLGIGNNNTATTPTPLALTGIIAIASRLNSVYALKDDGTVLVWGDNGQGQLGLGDTTDRNIPLSLSSIAGATAIAATHYSGCAVAGGEVYCWGRNQEGQLGIGTTADSLVPVKVTGLTGVTALAGGFYTAYALKSDGTVWAWGGNGQGQLGIGTYNSGDIRTAPVQVDSLANIRSIAAEGYAAYALDSNGNIWTWGLRGNQSRSLSPVRIPDPTDPSEFFSGVEAIGAGFYSGYAQKEDGTVWAWGDNNYGALGDNSSSSSTVPVQVSGFLSNACRIGTQTYSTLAAGLSAVADKETLTLLTNASYAAPIVLETKSFVLDTNGYNLTVTAPASSPCIRATGGQSLEVTDSSAAASGSLTLLAAGSGVIGLHADGGSVMSAVTTSISGVEESGCVGIYAQNLGSVELMEHSGIQETAAGSTGIYCISGGTVSVTSGAVAADTGIETAGVSGNTKSSVYFTGDVTGGPCGAFVHDGGSATITGSVTASSANGCGVLVQYGGEAAVTGNVTASASGGLGVCIGGTSGGGTATVDGAIAAAGTYIRVGGYDMTAAMNTVPSDRPGYLMYMNSTKPGYLVYVRDRITTCIVPGCTATVDEGGFTESETIDGVTTYHVATAAQLAHVASHMRLHFLQTADIDLDAYNDGLWTPLGGYGDPESGPGHFTGVYLGGDHTVNHLVLLHDSAAQYSVYGGLFASVRGAGAAVRDLTVNVKLIEIASGSGCSCGAVAGELSGGTISGCTVNYSGIVDISGTPNGNLGGVVGAAYPDWNAETRGFVTAEISGCSVTLDEASLLGEGGYKNVGGIAGLCDAKVTGCWIEIGTGSLICGTNVGGVAGTMFPKSADARIEGCTVSGRGNLAIAPQEFYSYNIGGIAGQLGECLVRNCANSVAVDATGVTELHSGAQVYAGGIAGYLGTGSELFGCRNTGNVVAAVSNNVVDNNLASVSPEGSEYAYAGGVAGFIYGYSNAVTVENCTNGAKVEAINRIPGFRAYAGGIAGHVDSGDGENAGVHILNCANLNGETTVHAAGGTTMTGGILGSTTFHDFATPNITVKNCYNRAYVIGEGISPPAGNGMCVGITAGGIIGAAGEADISCTYSTGDVIASGGRADAYAGGVFGVQYLTAATQNYYEKTDKVTRAVGGLVSGMTVIAADDQAGLYEGRTAAELRTASSYGPAWKWYAGGGTDPLYYSADAPWRFISASGLPVLTGLPYIPSGGGGGSSGGSGNVTYAISASAGSGGTISPAGKTLTNRYGSLTVTITPNELYSIADVTVDGVSVGAVTKYVFSQVTSDHTIRAEFIQICPSKPFADLDISLWYHSAVDYVLKTNLFRGISDKFFAPDLPMTRAMFITVLHRLDGSAPNTHGLPFPDVVGGFWYSEAIGWAYGNKLITGYKDGTFGPDLNITREQMASVLHRYALMKEYYTHSSAELTAFSDAGSVSDYALDAMKWAVGNGILEGDQGLLLPGAALTRAQAAAVLMRFSQRYLK